MIKKYFFKTFFNPKLCNKINIQKYPWGWKSKEEINKIANFKVTDNKTHMENERKFIHEYKLNEYTEDIYNKTYYAYTNNYDFLNSNLYCPKLANGLNILRKNSNIGDIEIEIKIKKVELIGNWIKYGRVKNQRKFLGLYDENEFIHEITTGMIGPEFQSIWDQQSIKQKVKLLIELQDRVDVFEFERNLMVHNDDWQLCNINRIIV
uniref:Uncharacterized protein n=1 Tax=viral metagenome TaxID=1070528 RepID=A0A6C0F7L6_9ZZZZ|tara:strand:- start:62729 stop:63349 length:621 start_codon:yes stop_codon:yes gene_type:complete